MTTDASSQFFSAGVGVGELRFYVAGQDLVHANALLNGTAHGASPFPNHQGEFGFGDGPYLPAVGNFAYYDLASLYNYNIDGAAAANILAALANGDVLVDTNLNQAEFGAVYDWDGGTQFITLNSPIASSSPNSLNLVATGDITINSNLIWNTDNPLSLIAGQDIVINDGVIMTHNSTGTFLLRADSRGTGNGTVTFNGVGAIQSIGGGRVEILYNPTAYTAPTDYSANLTLSNNSSLFAGMLVNNVNDLQAISTNLSGNYALGRDIDAADTINWNSGAGFAPLGTNFANSYTGFFDGRGHSIFDLYINRGGAESVGLFGSLNGTVQDVRLIDADVTGGSFVGTLVGYNYDTIRRAHATGRVTATDFAGGLVGAQNIDVIELSSADVQVTGTGDRLGGLLGNNFGGVVRQSYATGNVSGNNLVGGLVGRSGGGTITESYSTGQVTGNTDVGGLVGLGFNASITNSFWDIETSGRLTSSGGTGLTTFQMQRQETFTDASWDFANVWHLQENASNPLFLNQALPAPSTKIALSGFVFDGLGSSTPVGVNQLVTVLVNGIPVGSAITGYNGEYGLLVDPLTSGNAVLSYLDGSPTTLGGHVWRTNGSPQGLDIFAGALVASASPGQQVNQSLFVDALGAHNDADIPYSISSLVLDPGISFVLNSGSHLVLDDDIITDGADILLNGTTSVSASAQLQSGRDIFVNGDISWDSTDTLTLLAERNIHFNANVQNSHATVGSGGHLNIVAGWDGSTPFNLASFQAIDVNAAPTLFGNNDGSVFIGSASQVTGVAVGSRHGNTNVFVHDVTLRSSDLNNSPAQLGFHDVTGQGLAANSTITTGDINVLATGRVVAQGGNAAFAYVQIGHGGSRGQNGDGNIPWNYTGDITLKVKENVTFSAGGVALHYAQLGNGGYIARGNHSGNHSITAAQDISFHGGNGTGTYAQLGNGGYAAFGNHNGNMTITTGQDITFQGGNGFDAYVQLGNGGDFTDGNHNGEIDINITGNLMLTGVDMNSRYVLIGNGDGLGDSDAGHHVSGNINLRVGNNASLTNAFIGHLIDADGTYSSGNTFIGVRGDLTADANSQFFSAAPAQNGELRLYLGGQDLVHENALLNGTAHGVSAFPNNQGEFVFGSGPYSPVVGNFAYYHLGERYNYTIGSVEAANIIAALANGDVILATNLNQADFGAIFDWGPTHFITVNDAILYDSTNSLDFAATGDITFNASVQNSNLTGGNINIVAGWDGSTVFDAATFAAVDVNAAPTLFGNNDGSVFIGSATQATGVAVGSRHGETNLFAHDLTLQGSTTGTAAHAQLGFNHVEGETIGTTITTGNINVGLTGSLSARGGAFGTTVLTNNPTSYVQIGHGGNRTAGSSALNSNDRWNYTGDITLAVAKDIFFQGGTAPNAYAQLGHGGLRAYGSHSGDHTIVTAQDITFTGGSTDGTSARFGNGGTNAHGNHSGNLTITTSRNVTFFGGGSRAYAQLGNGGTNTIGSHEGDHSIWAIQNITFTGGGSIAYAQIGNGGYNSTGNHTGSHVITTLNDIIFMAGSGASAYAQLGQGGDSARGDHSGTTTITTARDISFTAGSGLSAYAQLGHGGHDADGHHSGTTTITTARDISFMAGSGARAYAQLGQGGDNAGGDHSGTTTITTARDISFMAGSGLRAYAQLGHGGYDADGHHSGTTTITTANDITFTAGNGNYAYAQLGQGGALADGNHSGTTTFTTVNDITLTASIGEYAYAQLGQGGSFAHGNHSGTSTFATVNDITLTAGIGEYAYAQLGQGGLRAEGNHSGTTTIETARDITFSAGTGQGSYAQLGNGGFRADGSHSGGIDITLNRDLTLTGINTTDRYALIGHGNEPGDADNDRSVSGNITLRVGQSATLANAYIGHLIDSNGTYTSGNTRIAIGTSDYAPDNSTAKLTMDANSQFFSAAEAQSGELRIYLPNAASFVAADGAMLNGVDVATFGTGLPNLEGRFKPFLGTYTPDQGIGNFAFYLSFLELVVNANSGSSTYGDTPINPGLNLFSGRLINGDTLASIGLTNNFNLTAGSNAGQYTLTVDASSLDPNYQLTGTTAGTFTINKADLTITPTAQSKTYGDLFSFTGIEFTATGLKDNDAITSVALNSLGTPQSANAGLYDINSTAITGSTSFDANNYNITFGTLVEGFTVNKADLTITPTAQSKIYGDLFSFTGIEFTADGLKDNDVITSVALNSLGTPQSANAGLYDINSTAITGSTSFDANNYNITFGTLVEGFTVNKADLTITPTAQSKIYGDLFSFTGIEFTATGLKDNDVITSVALNSLGTPQSANAGLYDINLSAITGSTSFDANNYNITFGTLVDGFTVNKADLTITPTAQSKFVGEPFSFTGAEFTVTGLKLDDQITLLALSSLGAPADAVVGRYDISSMEILSSTSFDANNYNITFGTLLDGFAVNLLPVEALPGNLAHDQFTSYEDYFRTINSLTVPLGAGGMNGSGSAPNAPPEETEDAEPESGTIPVEIRLNGLQVSN